MPPPQRAHDRALDPAAMSTELVPGVGLNGNAAFGDRDDGSVHADNALTQNAEMGIDEDIQGAFLLSFCACLDSMC